MKKAKTLGELLTRHRVASRYSAKVIARAAGITRDHYYRYERNEVEPKLSTYLIMADLMDIEVSNIELNKMINE